MAPGLLDSRVELVARAHLADADARAAAARLDEDRVAQRVDRLDDGRLVAPPAAQRGDRVGQHRQAVRLQDHLHVVLVHADGGGEHTGADVADARHLQQALDRAVLAPRAVQQREDDVDLAEGAGYGAGLVHHDLARAVLLRDRDRRSRGVHLRQLVGRGDREPLRVARLQHPAPVVGDARPGPRRSGRGRSRGARCLPSRTRSRARRSGRRRPPRCVACGSCRCLWLGPARSWWPDPTRARGRASGAALCRITTPIGWPHVVRAAAGHPAVPSRDRGREGRSAPARARPAAQRAADDGVDVRRGRGPGVRPLRQPDVGGVREGARRPGGRPGLAFASGLATVATILDLVGVGAKVVAPRHAYLGSIGQIADLEARGRIRAELVDVTDTASVVKACEDAALVWLESPTNPALEVADVAAIVAAAHEAGAYVVGGQHVRHSAAAAAARRWTPTWWCTRRRSSSPGTATCCWAPWSPATSSSTTC